MEKPFSQACENNKKYILKVLKNAFKNSQNVLEIGSGTGQHAVYFAEKLPHLIWHPSDKTENLEGIKLWIDEACLSNINDPSELNVNNIPCNFKSFDAVFSANTFHIMGKNEVECFFEVVCTVLVEGGKLCVYGPFNYNGKYTSESNKNFDRMIQKRNSESGIKDFEWVNSLAQASGCKLLKDHEMPANNRLLEWKKTIITNV